MMVRHQEAHSGNYKETIQKMFWVFYNQTPVHFMKFFSGSTEQMAVQNFAEQTEELG